MREYGHGGDIYKDNDREVEILDFSSNLNPLGMPESAVSAIIDEARKFNRYPDPHCRKLAVRVMEWENSSFGKKVVETENLVFGNGAADLIYRTVSAVRPERGIVAAPTFSEYEKAMMQYGCTVEHLYLKEEKSFGEDEDIFRRLEELMPADMIFWCNPNNPAGNLFGREFMLRLCRWTAERNIILVVDECFMELTDRNRECSLVPYVSEFGNLIILKAFTKVFAMAGLRLGYLICYDSGLCDAVYDTGQPWSVSSAAQAAGCAAAEEREYLDKAVELINSEREILGKALADAGMKVYDSDADFILFRCGSEEEAEELQTFLKERGILVRSCANYVNLDGRYVRTAVKSRENNRYLMEKLEEYRKWQNP